IEKFGSYSVRTSHYNIDESKKKVNQYNSTVNPYVKAFWKWWPDLYPKLKIFRINGGEPLLDENTFKILDYIEKYSNPALELSITTNLCVPEKNMDRLIEQINRIMRKEQVFKFIICPSIDTWGEQAEYIRDGLDVEQFEQNIERLLSECSHVSIDFAITTTALSIFSLKALLQKILNWHLKYSKKKNRIDFNCTYLSNPSFQALNILPQELVKSYVQECQAFLLESKKKYNFSLYEINQMNRLLLRGIKPFNKEKKRMNRIDFYKFFKEYDHRRNKDFLSTFPQLKNFWTYCETLADTYEYASGIPRFNNVEVQENVI
ncbi:MAG: twitch domain-containing radical SAM protein, partial [Halobacteriovoraceae bacterium]|nr:twitch domain-containing radical SAM protein [Halobacteriovoraceae bacterium]